ncbi:MAG: hypothetical protein BWK80_21810 [Desulfobacteraceae bacterium IS3]|nr:MAG: hypothetical protein BWK80_21810 [Desulfobacteraceae bacterium IS3]
MGAEFFFRRCGLKRFASVLAWAFYSKTALQAVFCLFQHNGLKNCQVLCFAGFRRLSESGNMKVRLHG